MNVFLENTGAKEIDVTVAEQHGTSSTATNDTAFDKERLADIQQELAANQQHWPERIAASVEEDYQQLLKDFGLR